MKKKKTTKSKAKIDRLNAEDFINKVTTLFANELMQILTTKRASVLEKHLPTYWMMEAAKNLDQDYKKWLKEK